MDVPATIPANKTAEAKSVTPALPTPVGKNGEESKSSPDDLAYSTHLKVSLAAGDRVLDWDQLRVKRLTPLTCLIAESIYRELTIGPFAPGNGNDLEKPLTTTPYFGLPPFNLSLWKETIQEDIKPEETKEDELSESVEDDDQSEDEESFSELWEVSGPASIIAPMSRTTLVKLSTAKGVKMAETLDRQRVDPRWLHCCLAVQLALQRKKRQFRVSWSGPIEPQFERKAQSTKFCYQLTLKIIKRWCYAVRLKSQRALRAIVQNSCNLGFELDLNKSCEEPWLKDMASDILLDVLEDRLEARMKFVTCEMAQRLLNDEEHRDPVPPPKWLKIQPSLTSGPPVVSFFRGEMYAWWVKLCHTNRPKYLKMHGTKEGFIEQSANDYLMQAQCLLQLKKGFPEISAAFLAKSTSEWYGLSELREDPAELESLLTGTVVCGEPTRHFEVAGYGAGGRIETSEPVSVYLMPPNKEDHVMDVGELVSVKEAPTGGRPSKRRARLDKVKGYPLLCRKPDDSCTEPPRAPSLASLSTLGKRKLDELLDDVGQVFDEIIDAVQSQEGARTSSHISPDGKRVKTPHPTSIDRSIVTPGIKATYEANRPEGGTFHEYQEFLIEFSQQMADLSDLLDSTWAYGGDPDDDSDAHSEASTYTRGSNGSFWWHEGRDAYHSRDVLEPVPEVEEDQDEKETVGLKQLRGMVADLCRQVFRVPLGEFTSTAGKVVTIDCLLPVSALTLARSSVVSSLVRGLRVVPQALAEPFKVRLISKGPALAYWLARLMQKHMHSSLVLLPEFELAGLSGQRSIAEVITEVLGTPMLAPGPFGLKAASCDYKGSTDNLAPRISNSFAVKWAKRFGYSTLMTRLLICTLTQHVLVKETPIDPAACWKRWVSDGTPWPLPVEYPEDVRSWLCSVTEMDVQGKGPTVDTDYLQQWGQLMGSCTSFPVLCVANLALTLVGLRRAERDIPQKDQVWAQSPFEGDLLPGRVDRKGRPVPCRDPLRGNAWFGRPVGHSGCVVNGDDLLYLAFASGIAEWKRVTTIGGLAPSQGKNYVSHLFGNINSTMFTLGLLQFDPLDIPATAHLASQATMGPSAPAVRAWLHVPYPNLAVLMPPKVLEYEEFLACGPAWQNAYLNVNAKFSSDASPKMQASRAGWCAATRLSKDDMCCWWIRAWAPYLAYIPKHYMNWFHPRQLGGFGLEATRPYESTALQLRIAKAHMDNVDPTQWLENTIGFGPDEPEVLTSTREDALVVEKHLIDQGVLKRVLLHDESLVAGQRVPDLSRLELSLVLSGFSGHVLPVGCGQLGVPVDLETYQDELAELHYSDRAYPGTKAACRRAERLARSSRKDYKLKFSCAPLIREGPMAGALVPAERTVLKKAQCWLQTCQIMAKKSSSQSGRTTEPSTVHAWRNRVVLTVLSDDWSQTSVEPALTGDPATGRIRFGVYPVSVTELSGWDKSSDLAGPPGYPVRVQTSEVSPNVLFLEWPANRLLQEAFGDGAFEFEADDPPEAFLGFRNFTYTMFM